MNKNGDRAAEKGAQPVRVSVVVPCYNAERYLRETLQSAMRQTHPPLEILVVNDGSTDRSVEIAESFGPIVRVIHQPNQGESVARNRGMDEARGDWIAFLDADDVWAPTKLEKQVALIEPGVVCVHTDYYYFGTRTGVRRLASFTPSRRYRLTFMVVKSSVHPSSAMVRRTVRSRFPTWTQHAEDMVFFTDVRCEGQMRIVAEPLTGYRCHGSAQSKKPGIERRWHQTAMTYIHSRPDYFSPKTVDYVKRAWHNRLVVATLLLLLRRRFADYVLMRRYVRSLGPFYSTLALEIMRYGRRIAVRNVRKFNFLNRFFATVQEKSDETPPVTRMPIPSFARAAVPSHASPVRRALFDSARELARS